MLQSWYSITISALNSFWIETKIFIPRLIGALIIIIIGWFVSVIIGKIVAEILRRIKFNVIFEKGRWKEVLEKAEWKVDPSGFIGAIIKWVLFIAFLVASIEALGFVQFTAVLAGFVDWLPNVVIAAAIFIVAVIAAEYIPKIIRALSEGVRMKYGTFLEEIIRWAIWTFAGLAILIQLGIAKEVIMTLFTGFVAFLAIAGGLAFGLGGKEAASRLIEGITRKLEEK